MATTGPKYPQAEVELGTPPRNAYVMASRARAALKRSGVSNEECEAFFAEALADEGRTAEVIERWATVL